MRNKHEKLQEALENIKCKFDILCFTETWLTERDSPPQCDGYKYEGLTRNCCRGGGLAMYVKRCIQYEVLHTYTVTNENVECLVIYTKCGYYCVIYRPVVSCRL